MYTGDPNDHEVGSFTSGLTGSCLCRAITITIQDNLFERPRGHLCHCSNCRKVAGSYVSSNLLIETDKVRVEDSKHTLTEFVDTQTGSGRPLSRFFCKVCGNPIMSVTPNFPDKVILKMGIFPRIPQPEMENFVDHKQSWQGKHDGLVQYKLVIYGDKVE